MQRNVQMTEIDGTKLQMTEIDGFCYLMTW